eukprot:6805151-Lingulodinium_polyedra.AAC.1
MAGLPCGRVRCGRPLLGEPAREEGPQADGRGRAADHRSLEGVAGTCIRLVRAVHAGGRGLWSLHAQGLGCSIARAGPGRLHGGISFADIPA